MVRNTDYIGKIVNYIKKNLKKGYTKESLKFALINQQHSRLEIERAFLVAEQELAREAPVLKTKPTIKYEVVEHKPIATSEPERKSFWKSFFD